MTIIDGEINLSAQAQMRGIDEGIIQNNYDFVSRWAAHYVMQRINETRQNAFSAGLPTGSTPLECTENDSAQ
jgi:6-phosphogluconolactonase/glucosamine-6-phosphate isomerase/deaminase